ncbi:MAG: hypothetical protein IPP79_24350 [Chitinophagaceae bacterium]|nr:hypothetical protein [Chitinophagaceae bacterium]
MFLLRRIWLTSKTAKEEQSSPVAGTALDKMAANKRICQPLFGIGYNVHGNVGVSSSEAAMMTI